MVERLFLIGGFALSLGYVGSTHVNYASLAIATHAESQESSEGLALIDKKPNFGTADYGEKRTATFTVQNVTTKSIHLVVIEKGCECTGVKFDPADVASGQQSVVTLKWVPKIDQAKDPLEDPRVTIRATIADRDGKTGLLDLVAEGVIKPSLFVKLPRGELDFGNLTRADLRGGKSRSIEIFTLQEKHRGFTATLRSTSKGLKVVPTESERLSAARLSDLKAVDGYRFNIEPAEGLAIGRFRERLFLKSSIYADRDQEIEVFGNLETGAVSVNPETVALPERIAISRGYICGPIEVTLRGEPNRELTFDHADLKFLQVTVEKRPDRDNVWKIKVRIPAGREELLKHLTPDQLDEFTASPWKSAGMTFKTTHPLIPTLRIPVQSSQLARQ